MSLYYFTTVEDDRMRDGVAIDLPDLKAARAQATVYAGDLIKEIDGDLFDSDLQVRVTDDTGLVLFTITTIAIEAPAVSH